MQKYNKSGCLSGGHLADVCDKIGHRKVNNKYPVESGKFWFTSKLEIHYKRQSCKEYKDYRCSIFTESKDKIIAYVRLFEEDGSMICYADIEFVKGTIQCRGLENEKGK